MLMKYGIGEPCWKLMSEFNFDAHRLIITPTLYEILIQFHKISQKQLIE